MEDKELFKTQGLRNWFTCALATQITRKGILDFVINEMENFQKEALAEIVTKWNLPQGSTCNFCTTQSIVSCLALNTSGKMHGGKCLSRKVSAQPCPSKICDNFVTLIEMEHRFKTPSWKNTDASKWCFSSWEIAKCFCPPDGYREVISANNTDFNGIISILQNCKRFDRLLSADLSTSNNLCDKVCAYIQTKYSN